jgi:hypothetical protein
MLQVELEISIKDADGEIGFVDELETLCQKYASEGRIYHFVFK